MSALSEIIEKANVDDGWKQDARVELKSLKGENVMSDQDCWGIVELMGHVTVAGRITKPGEYGGLWQVDVPEGETFRTEFFGSQSVYRIRIVSEEIARAYARPGHAIIEYNAPIVTREEHEAAIERAREEIYSYRREIEQLRTRLVAVNALPLEIEGFNDETDLEQWRQIAPDDRQSYPSDNRPVLIYDQSCDEIVIGYYSDRDDCFYAAPDGLIAVHDVLRWAELPQKPAS